MTRIYSYTQPLDADIVDAFCLMQKGFTDQFVYYRKDRPTRFMGLGRCIALPTLDEVECELTGPAAEQPVFFSFNRFDAHNPAPADELFQSFPNLHFMLPEVVLIENKSGAFLQVNSLGPVYTGRVERFARLALTAPHRTRRTVSYQLELDSRSAWEQSVGSGLDAIKSGRVEKVVLSRRLKLRADEPFSSKDLLVNLIDGTAHGTVLLYRYADVFFCGCTPELLVRKTGCELESMCLAGTCPASPDPAENERLAQGLLNDAKNRAEHDYVVRFIRDVLGRTCYAVDVPKQPTIMPLTRIQHLMTPARAKLLEGVDLWSMMGDLHPTPAVSGTPVGEAKMLIRRIEAYNRGVFDGEIGYVYAGCGIVDGSRAADEYDEIALKLKTVLSAFDGEAVTASSHAAQTSPQTTGETNPQAASPADLQKIPQVAGQTATQTAGQTSPQTTTAGKGEAR